MGTNMSRMASIVTFVFILLQTSFPSMAIEKYFAKTFYDKDNIQYKLYKCFKINGKEFQHHFMTIIDQSGTQIIRAHPGCDRNGWGTSLYLQPFHPGAVLGHTNIDPDLITCRANGIEVIATGEISYKQNQSRGTWRSEMFYAYNEHEKQIKGKGTYKIKLTKRLDDSSGDLNIVKIASNYLHDVPILDGECRDTGDMQFVTAKGDNDFSVTWIPPCKPEHFPQETSNTLDIFVAGNYNNVNSESQGHERLEPAYKPNIQLIIKSLRTDANLPMIFGAMYDRSKQKDFWEDNVGITPLVLKTCPLDRFDFEIEFLSTPLQQDSTSFEVGSD